MGQVKELHLCKNLNDLEQYFKIPNITNKSKMKSLIESAHKLLQNGNKHYQEGDEEYAYIYYMRYFNLLSTLRKMPTYTEYKMSIQKTLGGNTANAIIMDKLEEMTKSLSERYDRLNEKKNVPPPLTDDDMKFYNNLSASDKFNVVKASPSYEQIGDALKLISCKQLFQLMQTNTVLIMDCRCVDDYKVSHLNYNFSFNIPEEIILPGLSAGKLQDKLDNESKKFWSARSIKDQVVLMDWNCREATPNKTKSIAVLQDILQNWDPDCIYRSPIKIVDGGYEFFIMMYPTLCTNPTVQSPHHNQQNNDMIDDIEYPSIHDITMKDDMRPFSRSPLNFNQYTNSVVSTNQERPFIDRSSKTAALKTYNEKQKAIVEIMKEHDELVEKAQANDEQLEQAQQKWNTVTNVNKLSTAEQQLLYNIWQLESAAEDYRIENNRLRDELENYKRLDRETEKAPAIENEKIEEVTKKIETKIQERQKVDEQHEREKKQRETQLAIARENKRHMKPPVLEDEEMSQPKIPQFDRSVKPIIPNNIIETIHAEKRRDFSPIPGSMVAIFMSHFFYYISKIERLNLV
ncbi:ubiquitin carboxyl-terminal hydrolase 8-like [Teleopsis dalmanni]|uniref:ubiquitin carboxyl-terminal hydrolase 8-like n=1 Tax=Teleopsis dalmanni TaxID=139649 RepID=UPI0018CE9A9B|nr:ubiquitin carboxyl-terminal hydrolase 8-like [Teleopsis dalmanni]